MRDWVWRILIVVGFTAVYGALINSRAYSVNDWSRMGAVESLVERGTWQLDGSGFVKTLDKIKVGEHFYSTKPPTLAFLGAGVYGVLHYGLGMELQTQGCEPDFEENGCLAWREPAEADWAHYVIVLVLVCVPAAVMLAMLFGVTRRQGWPVGMGLLLVVTVGVGTGVWPYSTVFTNHVPAAVCVFVAVYLLLVGEMSGRRMAAVGFFVTLAGTLDLSTAVYLVVVGGYVLVYQREHLFYFVGGCLPPGLLAIVLNFLIVGNPLPPQFYTEGYEFEGSSFGGSVAGNRPPENPLWYGYRMLFGDWGVFAFYPVALVYLVGFARALHTAEVRVRRVGWAVAVGTLVYLGYFVFFTNNFGGFAFGVRWLLVPLPLLALFGVFVPDWARPSPWLVGSLVVLLVPSAVMGYRGALAPWQPDVPIVQLGVTWPEAREVIPIGISGYDSFEQVDPAIREGFGMNHVPRRWFDATQGFVVPQGVAWWFIGARTPPADLFAERFGLGSAVDYALQADLTEPAEGWIGEMEQVVYQDGGVVPDGAAEEELALPQAFVHPQGDVALRGFEMGLEGERLAVVTAWQVVERIFPTGPRRVFVHLLDGNGEIVAQSDLFAGNYENLYGGDLFFQRQFVDVGGVESGVYWVQMGVYNPDTGVRLLVGGRDRLLLGEVVVE